MATIGVVEWYTGKNVFISGGSGFVGLCLIEKLLRCVPEIGTVYLMLRPKRGKEAQERLEDIKKNAIFERIAESEKFETAFSQVKVIAGDIGEPDLGISAADRQTLTENVNVIFHSAATLDFAEGLKSTVTINLLGTRNMLELASQCRQLNAFVHVSSTYVNSWRLQAEEIIYPLKEDSEKIVKLVQTVSEEELDAMTPELLGEHLNTYTFTKHMGEHEVQKMQERFPCTIVRPSMIIGAWKEPIPGWTISKNGPQGFLMGAAKGVVRRLPVSKDLIYDYIPVDIVVNQLIAAGCFVGTSKQKTVQVYQCTSSTRQPFRWKLIDNRINDLLLTYPVKSAVWYPNLKFLSSITWFRISAFFFHIIPALILDSVTKITGGRPILMRMHRNIDASLTRLEKFIFTEWSFSADNTQKLQEWLSADDKVTFNLDLSNLDWLSYFVELTKGVRRYLNNEKLSTLNAARSRQRILLGLHVVLQLVLLLSFWYGFSVVSGLSMKSSSIVVSLVYFFVNIKL